MIAHTERLTAALEPEVRQITDAVVARVAEIEQEAVREARELSERSERDARVAARFALDRSLQLTSTLEEVAGTVTEMTSALRTGVDAALEALRNLQAAQAELPSELKPRPSEAERNQPDARPEPDPRGAQPEFAGAKLVEWDVEPESDGGILMHLQVGPSPETVEMFREQITMMRDDGKPRNEAKRVLKRYRWGRHFFGMLDEIYSTDGSADAGRHGLIRKLRSRG
jgi:hypothetical protein